MPFVLDEWLGVSLPKTVFIQNARLGCLHIFLMLIVVGYVVATLLTNIEVVKVIYTPDMAFRVWTSEYWTMDGQNLYKKASRADMRSDMCDPAKNDRYDYWYDKSGDWRYTNQTCVELGPRDRAMKSATSAYVPTYVDEEFIWTKLGDKAVAGSCTDAQCLILGKCPGDSTQNYISETVTDKGQCLCKCSTNQNKFATGVEHIVIAFSHLPEWPEPVKEAVKSQGVDPAPKNLLAMNMVTVVRDSGKNEFTRFAPGEDIRLTVADLLLLGGKYSLEDHSHGSTSHRNHLLDQDLPAEYKAKLKLGPHLRVSGLSVDIQVSYFNAGARAHVNDEFPEKPPIAYVDVHILPAWTGQPVGDVFQSNQAGEGEMRSRYYYGVQVTFSASGSYEFFDTVKVLTSLASIIVYLAVPNMIIVYLTKFGLGTLSEIYYEAQCTLLDTWELFSGQVCRALVGMVIFHKISSMGRHSTAGGGVTPSQTLALTSAAPEEEEASALTPGQQKTLNLNFLKTELMELFESQEGLDQIEVDTLERCLVKILEDGQPIKQFSFIQAVVNGDIGSLKGWAKLFDEDRKPCCLERLFDTQRKSRRQFHEESLRCAVGQSNATIVSCQTSSGPAESPETQTPEKDEGETSKKDEPAATNTLLQREQTPITSV